MGKPAGITASRKVSQLVLTAERGLSIWILRSGWYDEERGTKRASAAAFEVAIEAALVADGHRSPFHGAFLHGVSQPSSRVRMAW